MTNVSLLRKCAFALPFVILHSAFVISPAHPADISHLKVRVEPQRIEFRLTFNLYTLQQFQLLDIDENGKITRQELDAGEKPLRDYLSKHVLITINGEDSDLGEARRMERMWPSESAGADVMAPDYAQRFVDFTFVKTTQPVVADVWIGFNFFNETGELHTVQGVFEQDGKPTEVLFSQNEPEYLWDTGFAETSEPAVETTHVAESPVPVESSRVKPIAVVIGIVVFCITWLVLRKVRQISRGSFEIGPRE